MTTTDIKQLQDQYLIPTYGPELAFVKGRGVHLWDADGNAYLDFTSGISVCNLGHCHPVVTEAIQRQAARLVHVSNLFMNDVQPRLAQVISQKSFGGKLFFANSGAEANEGLIKFARKWGHDRGKFEIVCMSHCFHGRTLATLAATDKGKIREGFAPDMPGFRHVPFNDVDQLAAAVNEKTAAILIEPIQGEGGVNVATAEFLTAARTLCDERGLLLMFDEVQCGMGRTGELFAYQHFGVTPDAMSLAKALGNGFPIGAFAVRAELANVLPKGSHASTFGGTALACAASLAVFQTIDAEDILFHCQRMGEYLKGKLVQLASKHAQIKDVRGVGLLVGVECSIPVESIVRQAQKLGLLILTAGENVIRILPPLVIEQDEIDDGIKRLDDAISFVQP